MLWTRHVGRSDFARQQQVVTRNGDDYVIETKGQMKAKSRMRSPAKAATGESPIANGTRDEEIRRRAYEIYLERGEEPGHELDD